MPVITAAKKVADSTPENTVRRSLTRPCHKSELDNSKCPATRNIALGQYMNQQD